MEKPKNDRLRINKYANAIENQDLNITDEIEDAFADGDLTEIKKLFYSYDNLDEIFLSNGFNCDDMEIFDYVCQVVSMEYRYPDGETALTYLLRDPFNKYDHINIALKYVKDINLPGKNGDTALSLILKKVKDLSRQRECERWVELTNKILNMGGIYKEYIEISDLFAILKWNNFDMVETLLPFIKDINETVDGINILFQAKVIEHDISSDIIELLEESGAFL